MSNVVAISSFVWSDNQGGPDVFFRQDTTTAADTDDAPVAVPGLFIPAGGAKTAAASFVNGSRFYRKGKTKVAVTDAAYVAAAAYFT